MAARTFNNGVGDGDMNNGGNYTGSGAILATDDLTFDNTSVANVTASAALTCASITVAATYTGAWSDGGYKISTSGAQTYSGDGANTTVTSSGELEITGDASLTFNSTIKTLTLTSCDIDLQGTGNLESHYSNVFRCQTLTCAYPGKTTTLVATAILWYECKHTSTPLVLGGGTLTINEALKVFVRGTTTAITYASSTINGTENLVLDANLAGITMTIPAITTTTNHQLQISASADATIEQTGALQAKNIAIQVGTNNVDLTYNGNGNSLTCDTSQGYFYCGVYTTTTGSTMTYNPGDGATITAVRFDFSAYGNGAGSTHNWGNANIVVSENITMTSNLTCNAGTSTWTLGGATACSLTSGGNTIGSVVVNKTANGVTLQDALTCANLTLTDGDFDLNGQALSCANLTVASSDTLTLDANVTATGNGDYDVSVTFSRLILTSGTTHTVKAATTLTLSSYTATDWDGITLASDSGGTAWNFANPAGMSVAGVTVSDSNATNAISATGTDGGGNTNWDFPTSVTGMLQSRSSIGIGIGIGA